MMRRDHVIRLGAIVLALGLTGCASTQAPVSQYTLPDVPMTGDIADASASHQLLIRPLRLASFLEVEGIILQVDPLTLQAAQQHQWAEPLGRQLERGLRDRLATRLPDTRVMLDSEGSSAETSLSLRMEMSRFQGRHDGLAIAEGRWQLRDAQGELLALTPFSVTTPLASDGYPALVEALGEDLDRLADQLASRIQRLR